MDVGHRGRGWGGSCLLIPLLFLFPITLACGVTAGHRFCSCSVRLASRVSVSCTPFGSCVQQNHNIQQHGAASYAIGPTPAVPPPSGTRIRSNRSTEWVSARPSSIPSGRAELSGTRIRSNRLTEWVTEIPSSFPSGRAEVCRPVLESGRTAPLSGCRLSLPLSLPVALICAVRY